MKLLQLLAKELKEWPEGAKYACQDTAGTYEGSVFFVSNEPEHSDGSGGWSVCGVIGAIHNLEVSSDAKINTVTKSQWQAEREKMNKPKWIRHRAGWMPVGAATIVEVRLRCGDIQKHEACEFLWRHKDCDSAVNIMAYRIIEETKDQEIEEVKKTNFGTITYKLEIDATEATKEIDSLVAKWGQIESPLKWRDAIIHCQAIIEDCEREIERNVNLLDAEGLMMQKDSKKAMQHYQTDIDMSDWRNWQAGDIFEVVKKTDYFTVGNRYSVKYTANTDAPITATDDDGDEFCLLMEEIKFIRRP
ncbi:MAG: hypothetical protein J6A65_10640 [Pseudomonas sp.]|nr:hypothetical protein [Pseudomonas sp.]